MADELPPVAAVETPAAPDPAEPAIPTDESSFAEHEAAFGPVDPSLEGEARDQAEASKQKIRHRAKSQQASPQDVPRIRELTRKLHEAEAERDSLKALTPRPPVTEPVRPSVQQPPASSPRQDASTPKLEPTRPKPTEDQIGEKYATYGDFVEDLSEWKFEQRQAAWQQGEDARRQEAAAGVAQQEYQKVHEAFGAKLAEFKKTHPDYDTLAAQHVNTLLPPVANKALLTHEHGPALVYHLFQHPELLAEVQFLMDGKPPSEENVALATRWLSSRIQAGTTGSAAPTPPIIVAPRPPNPVRTGPTQTGEDLPGDDSSLAEHEHAFGSRRRR